MNFNIINAGDSLAHEIYHSYCASFPEDERRGEAQFWDLFDNEYAQIISIVKEEKNIGYLILWELSEFVFVEHFEIFSRFRGQNFGSEVLAQLIQKHGELILETEPVELNTIAERRVKFYERNGFSILKKDYIQPSYGDGKNALNLFLMGTFSPEDLEKSIAEIYEIIY